MTNANTMHPGLPGYTGPTTGPFALLHHGRLFEWSHNVMERVDYVRREKNTVEVPIRLRHMLYLGGCRVGGMAAYVKARDACDKARDAYDKARDACDKAGDAYDKARDAYYKASDAYDKARDAYCGARDAHDKAWNAVDRAAVLAYIRKHVPDCRWDGKELLFN